MKYFSLFSGIGGFELGIQQAYALSKTKRKQQGRNKKDRSLYGQSFVEPQCIGYSEIDKYAIQVYQKHFPEHNNYGDITKIDETKLPDFDLLVGGFPCQAFSIAGKRKGFEDTRGTLFFEIARILRAKQPRLFLLENVKGLLSHDSGKTFSTIIVTLNELGYDLQWQVLNSKNHGVPQNRERVFIVGHLRGTSRPEVFPISNDGGQTDELPRHIANTITRRYEGAQATGSYIGEGQLNAQEIRQPKIFAHYGHKNKSGRKMSISPTLKAQSHGHEPMVFDDYNHRMRTDGNVGTVRATFANEAPGNGNKLVIKVPEAVRGGYSIAEQGDSINLAVPNSKTRRGRVGKGVAQTLDTGMQQHTLTSDMQIRRLTPVECERLQGFPDNWTDCVSDTQRYKCCGNAVTVNVIHHIISRLVV